MKKSLALIPLAAVLSGCWTFNETPFPETVVPPASTAAAERSITVAGFETYVTDYESVHSVHTVYVPGHYGHRHYSPGYFEVVPSVSYVPQTHATDIYLQRAKDTFEKAGFTLGTGTTDHTIEVRFEGPFDREGDLLRKLGWMLGTVFFCDYNAVRWAAHLRIRDSRTGKLVFSRDYTQDYETNDFGLIPIFGIASCDRSSPFSMKNWCLTALTDHAVADATAFLSNLK